MPNKYTVNQLKSDQPLQDDGWSNKNENDRKYNMENNIICHQILLNRYINILYASGYIPHIRPRQNKDNYILRNSDQNK